MKIEWSSWNSFLVKLSLETLAPSVLGSMASANKWVGLGCLGFGMLLFVAIAEPRRKEFFAERDCVFDHPPQFFNLPKVQSAFRKNLMKNPYPDELLGYAVTWIFWMGMFVRWWCY